MRALPLVAASLVLAGLPAAATAAPRPAPACQQLTDASGDGKAFGVADSKALDILSGDVATGRKTLVVALRMATLERDHFEAGGASYTVFWTANGVRNSVAYHVYVGGETAGRYDPDASSGQLTDELDVPVAVDPSTGTIRWTVPRSIVTTLKKPRTKITALAARVHAAVNRRGNGEGRSSLLGGDTAESTRTYTDMAPTCLKAT